MAEIFKLQGMTDQQMEIYVALRPELELARRNNDFGHVHITKTTAKKQR